MRYQLRYVRMPHVPEGLRGPATVSESGRALQTGAPLALRRADRNGRLGTLREPAYPSVKAGLTETTAVFRVFRVPTRPFPSPPRSLLPPPPGVADARFPPGPAGIARATSDVVRIVNRQLRQLGLEVVVLDLRVHGYDGQRLVDELGHIGGVGQQRRG